MRADRIAMELAKCSSLGTGFATNFPGPLVTFLKTDPSLRVPDMQLLFQGAPLGAEPYLLKPFADGFACVVVLLRPESRGHVKLACADPTAAPRIHQRFLSSAKDWPTLRKAIPVARAGSKQGALQKYIAAELAPGAGKE